MVATAAPEVDLWLLQTVYCSPCQDTLKWVGDGTVRETGCPYITVEIIKIYSDRRF